MQTKQIAIWVFIASLAGKLVGFFVSKLPPPIGHNQVALFLLPFWVAGAAFLLMLPRTGPDNPDSSNISALRAGIVILMLLGTASMLLLFFAIEHQG